MQHRTNVRTIQKRDTWQGKQYLEKISNINNETGLKRAYNNRADLGPSHHSGAHTAIQCIDDAIPLNQWFHLFMGQRALVSQLDTLKHLKTLHQHEL